MSLRLAVWSLALLPCLALGAPRGAVAAPCVVERLSADVLVVRGDTGNWGGGSMGITHQVGPHYWAKKVLDLSDVPEDFWRAATQVRLSAFFCVRDYSWRVKPQRNGLDEEFEVVVNGKAHRYKTSGGFPVFREGKAMSLSLRWHDFALPKGEFVRGRNEIIFRKVPTPGRQPDDYLYLGIDNTVRGGNSWVRFSEGAPWRQDKLTIPGGKGEYMVRVYLIRGDIAFETVWRPKGQTEDALGMFAYAGSHGPTTRVEWDPRRLDRLSPVSVVVEIADATPFELRWLDEQGDPKAPLKGRGPRHEITLHPPLAFRPSGIELDKTLPVRSVALRASRNYHPLPRRLNMAPRIRPPRGRDILKAPTCRLQDGQVVLENRTLRCALQRKEGRLRLDSLFNRYAAGEVVRRPDDCALFLVEVDGKRYAGSRDFVCRAMRRANGGASVAATLFCQPVALEAALEVRIQDEGLRMDLKLTNRGDRAVDFKVAFPHLSGLAISDDLAGDYHFFPWGGGVISDAPALIRRGYGDHAAIYQLMDLFSPSRGAGLAIWRADSGGRYCVLALRKHIPGRAEMNGDRADTPTTAEYKWTNCLPPVPGIGVAYEYLRRTRKPGESFVLPGVVLRAHEGDWHAAMEAYAKWCRGVWRFRPYPSRLTPIINMLAAGWGQSPLHASRSQKRVSDDCGYRTDFVRPRCDCIELMSWWEWSPLGPQSTPLDQVKEKLGEAKYQRWKSYFVRDPVMGKLMFSNNPGDYDGYNRRWGGLPALRKAIEAYRKMGAMVTLYTDPLRVDHNTNCGRKWGKAWGVVQPDGTYRTDYDAWRMCHDVAEYRRWVADTMRRVMQETGADGIRLDEYGHRGSACFSKLHPHTFAEWGCTEWQRGIAEATRLVRQAMDAVKPGSVLTTEHPGYDFLMPFIEGCITYDLTVQATPLRPLEVNLQRFYFPECKAFELDHRGADRKHRKRFWNAVGSFGSYYPVRYYNILRECAAAFASRHCDPLVPTLAKFVYANRFRSRGQTVWTLYNATGHTFAGPVLQVAVGKGEHLFDLLACQEADLEIKERRATVRLFLPRDDAACLALLPRRLSATRAGNILTVSVADPRKGWHVRLCDRDGEPLMPDVPAERPVRFDLSPLPAAVPRPACVKLLSGTRLIDAATVPHTQ